MENAETAVLSVDFVDAHQHFQDIERHSYPWLSDPRAPPKLEGDLAPIRRNYLPEDYLGDLKGARVVKSVHVQNGWDPSDPVGETRWLMGLAAKTGFPHAIVAYADLAASDAEALLAGHAAHANVRGIRQILNWHRDPIFRVASRGDLMGDAAWRRGYALLSRFRMSFDLQIYWTQMDDAFRLASDFPDIPIVLNHFGMPVDRSIEGISSWATAMVRLARASNVSVKLSGLGLGHPRWTIDDTAPLLLRAIDIFGVDRAMFATNLPVDRLFASTPSILRAYESVANRFSPPSDAHFFKATPSGSIESDPIERLDRRSSREFCRVQAENVGPQYLSLSHSDCATATPTLRVAPGLNFVLHPPPSSPSKMLSAWAHHAGRSASDRGEVRGHVRAARGVTGSAKKRLARPRWFS